MKINRKLIVLVLVLVLMITFASCSNGNAPSGTGGDDTGREVTVTDMGGRKITLPKPASRVVAVTAADCEIVAALAPETLVGRGQYCDWPESILEVPAVQSGSELAAEQILALEPDVIIMSTMAQTAEQVDSLERAGITVIETTGKDIADVYEAIRLIGAVLGKDEDSESIVLFMQAYFDLIETEADKKSLDLYPSLEFDTESLGETTGPGKPTIYFEVSPLEYGLWAAGKGTFMDEIAAMLGLENAFSDVEGWVKISQEQVIERDPDYIITSSMYFGDGPQPVDEIISRAGWGDISAVANARVFHADADEITRPGPRLMDAAAMLYELIYGEKITLDELTVNDRVISYRDGVLTYRDD